jgi:hypothetical protein
VAHAPRRHAGLTLCWRATSGRASSGHLIVVGMTHQGVQVSLGEHGAGQWIAVFYAGHRGHEPVAAAGTMQAATPWRAVQRAAWDALVARQ